MRPTGASRERAGGLAARWALLAAMAGGLALAAAFPPVGAWPLAAAGPALLIVALWRSSARFSLVIGLVFGAAFFAPLLARIPEGSVAQKTAATAWPRTVAPSRAAIDETPTILARDANHWTKLMR